MLKPTYAVKLLYKIAIYLTDTVHILTVLVF